MTSDTLLRQEFHELYKSCADEQAGGGEIIDYFKLEDEVMALVSKAVEEGLDLVYWQYKELNGQSVDMKFVEAYNIIKAELTGKGGQNG